MAWSEAVSAGQEPGARPGQGCDAVASATWSLPKQGDSQGSEYLSFSVFLSHPVGPQESQMTRRLVSHPWAQPLGQGRAGQGVALRWW